MNMDQDLGDIIPGIEDTSESDSSGAKKNYLKPTSSNLSSIPPKPLISSYPARQKGDRKLPFKVLKFSPHTRGNVRYQLITEGEAIADVTRTPPPHLHEKRDDPSHKSSVDDVNIKEILQGFVQAFLSTIGSKQETVQDPPKLITTPVGSRIPFIPIDPATGRKFERMHPAPHQLLPILSSNTIPVLGIEPPGTPLEEQPSNVRRDSLRASTISPEKKSHLLQEANRPIRFSESVMNQNQKTERIYLHFCSEMSFTPYPISTECLLAFLLWVAESHKFNANSIDTILYSSLCRLSVVRSGLYIDPLTQYAARALIGSFYRDPSIKPPRGGMTPLIPDDVGRIVRALDLRDPKSYELAALFTFALSTGARGNSCANVHLADLGPLYESENAESILVVTIVKLKGRPSEKLQLSLAGNIDHQSPVDVLYWLNQHLLRNFHISLRNLIAKEGTESVDLNALLWPYKTDSMTQYLKSRMETAGLSSRGFGFHSFRSGFLASCLIQGEKRGEPIADVLVRCALITGWKALGKIEFSYIREAARRRVLPTNMIGLTSANPFTLPSTIEDQTVPDGTTWKHANSLEYHASSEITPHKRRSNLFRVKQYLAKSIWVKEASTAANRNYINCCYRWCLRQFGKELYESGEVLEEEESRFKEKSKLYEYLGFQFLDRGTSSNPDSLKGVAEEMLIELRTRGKIKSVLPASIKQLDRTATEAPRLFTQRRSGRCRVRLEWAEWEDQRLLRGIEEGEYADQIVLDLPARNQEDIYFHVRNLNKKRTTQNLPLLVLRRRRGYGGIGGAGGGACVSLPEHDSQESPSTDSSAERLSDSSHTSTQSQSEDSSSIDTDSQPRRRPPPIAKHQPHHENHSQVARQGGKRRLE